MKPMRKALTPFVGALALLLALTLPVLFGPLPVPNALAAPPTPITDERSTQPPKLVELFNAAVLTADTRSCTDSTYWDRADIQYVTVQNTVGSTGSNTTTLTLQFSNDRATYDNGVNIVASNATSAHALGVFNVFGVQTCVLADVTNTNPVTLTVKALLK